MNDLDQFDLPKQERIAHHSTEMPGRDRWVELSVYYLHTRPYAKRGRPWLAVTIAKSSLPGEVDRVQFLNAGSVERAMNIIHDTGPGGVVKGEAREWAIENGYADQVRPC